MFPDTVSFTSDYFAEIESLAIKMIELGKAYADDTAVEEMRRERMDGVESKSRNRSVEENLRLFKEMKNYTEEVQSPTTSPNLPTPDSVFPLLFLETCVFRLV